MIYKSSFSFFYNYLGLPLQLINYIWKYLLGRQRNKTRSWWKIVCNDWHIDMKSKKIQSTTVFIYMHQRAMVLKNRIMMIYPFIIHGSAMQIHCWGASLLKNDLSENCWPLSDSQPYAGLPWFFLPPLLCCRKTALIIQESNAMGQKNPFVVALAFTE